MLNVYQSNRTERLADALAQNLAAHPAGPFEQTVILTHSFGLGQWLRISLAERLGITAGINTSLPSTWIWQFCQQLPGFDSRQRRSSFENGVMTFVLARLLTKGTTVQEHPALARYVGIDRDQGLRAYQLAARLAAMFDQYLLYRPDWMLDWESGNNLPEDELAWVAALWRELSTDIDEPHRVQLYQTLEARLAVEPPKHAPQRLTIFGLSSLPPCQLRVFQHLADHIDVDIYFLNPCQHYWGDIASERDQARRSIRQLVQHGAPLADKDYFEAGNPLLSSMGKQGREFLEMLLELPTTVMHEDWVDPGEHCMLSLLQRDILQLECGGSFTGNAGTHQITSQDWSVQVHSCHSPLREIEVLYDQLQLLFETTVDLHPHEVIVMIPNLSRYAPFVEARFRGKLPFSIADRAGTDSALILSFRTLLDSASSRLTAPEVMDLLEVPLIAARYGLLESDLATLSAWIGQSGIRWGLSGEEKANRWELPAQTHNTWEFGLDRMLHGFAARSDDGLIDGVLPFDVDSGDVRLLTALQSFIDDLSIWSARLREPRSMPNWAVTLTALIDTFYGNPDAELLELQLIRDSLAELVTLAAQAGFDGELDPAPMREALDSLLSNSGLGGSLLSGGITFASLVPMRSIPFRVVCLLGMNDGEFPRVEPAHSFDLRAGEHRAGDRSRRLDDQYLFLESILAAREVLYLSYCGRRVTDNGPMLPSILVSELTQYCNRVMRQDNKPPELVIEHPLQPFDTRYFCGDARLASYQHEWQRGAIQDQASFLNNLPVRAPVSVVELSELVSFFRHPARYFLRTRLGVVFEDHASYLNDVEAFTLSPLDQYSLAESALAHSLAGGNPATWHELSVASGNVLPGTPGKLMLDEAWRKATEIVSRVDSLVDTEPFTKPVDLVLGDVRVVGHVGFARAGQRRKVRDRRQRGFREVLVRAQRLPRVRRGGAAPQRRHRPLATSRGALGADAARGAPIHSPRTRTHADCG